MLNTSIPPNRNQGEGHIPVGRRKHKPHKSQPHHKPPKRRPTQRLDPNADVKAATNLQFAPQDAEIKQEQQAIPGWYDDYLRKLQGLQTQTTEQYKGLQDQASSLAETVHAATPEGQKAQESRNNIVAAIQGALLQQGGAAFTRNQEMAGVAGLQKTVKQGQVQADKKKLSQLKGNFATKYKADKQQTDFENTLAAKQFGLKAEDLKIKADAEKKKPKPETTYDKEFSKQAAKLGFSPHDWALLGPRGRATRIAEYERRQGRQPKSIKRIEREEQIKQAAKHGYTTEEWNKLPSNKRSAIIRNVKPGKDGKPGTKDKGTEFDWKPSLQRSRGAQQAARWKNDPGIAKLFKKGTKRSDVAKQILSNSKSPDDPALVSALLDALYDGHLSRETARRLQNGGYKAREIAQALNTPTFTEWRRQAAKKQRQFENSFVHKGRPTGRVPKHHPTGPGGQGVT